MWHTASKFSKHTHCHGKQKPTSPQRELACGARNGGNSKINHRRQLKDLTTMSVEEKNEEEKSQKSTNKENKESLKYFLFLSSDKGYANPYLQASVGRRVGLNLRPRHNTISLHCCATTTHCTR